MVLRHSPFTALWIDPCNGVIAHCNCRHLCCTVLAALGILRGAACKGIGTKEKGMRVRDEIPEDHGQPYLVKKPTKWMTHCRPLAELLSLRCDGTHSHVRLEGGTLTKRAASYPVSLVRDILKVVVKVKQLAKTANYPKDPTHVTIPESLQESEHGVQVAYTQKTIQAYDTRTPRAVPWDSVVVRRTLNRKTGVVMDEDYPAELTEVTLNRP